MAEAPEAIAAVVTALTQPEARGRLLALGLARGMVWRDGVVPEDGSQIADVGPECLLKKGEDPACSSVTTL